MSRPLAGVRWLGRQRVGALWLSARPEYLHELVGADDLSREQRLGQRVQLRLVRT